MSAGRRRARSGPSRRGGRVFRLLAGAALACLAVAVPAPPAGAAEVPTHFDSVTLVANPNGWRITGLPNTIDGSVAGWNIARIFTGARSDATGVVIDYAFATPRQRVTQLQLYNNGGGILTDADGIGSALVEVFDSAANLLFSGTLNAGNGGGPFNTPLPAPLDDVARVRLSNITNLLPGVAAPDIIWRELRVLQEVATPSLSTQINADGTSDDVTITGTEGLPGTLTWTLHGPVAPGPSGTCGDADWAAAPVHETGTVSVTADGTVVTTPADTPVVSGCYSYGDVLSGPYYTADAVSAVGQPAETFFIAPEPELTLSKSATPNDPASFVVGQDVTYTFVARNTGNVTLTDTTVAETAFSGSGAPSAITCPGGNGTITLTPGQQVTCTATYTLTQADLDAGEVTNEATATGTSPDGTPIVSPPATTVIPADPEPGISLVKSATPQTAGSAGETITYSFLIENTGNVTLTDVQPVEETFTGAGALSAATCPAEAATMAPGEQVTCTATYTLTQADVDTGEVTNTATATGIPPGDLLPPVAPPADATVTIPSAAALTIAKTADPASTDEVGTTITYSFLITNTGNVTLTDVQPVEGPFSGSGTLSPITCDPAAASVAPGAQVTCTATYVLTDADVASGEVTNTATATGTPPDPDTPPPMSPPDDAVVTVPPPLGSEVDTPSISIVKTASPSTVTGAGEQITYSFLIANTGNTPLIDATVDEGAFSGTGTLSPVSCPPEAASMAPGAEVTCTATYTTTRADVDADVLTNTATATATSLDGSQDVVSEPSTVDIATPEPVPEGSARLTLTKTASTADANGNGATDIGDRIDWTLVVTNPGDATVDDVAVSDPTAGPVTCPSTTLDPGESMVCTAPSHTITADDAAAGSVHNTATAAGTDVDGAAVTSAPAEADVEIRSGTVTSEPDLPASGSNSTIPLLQIGALLAAVGAGLVLVARGVLARAHRERPEGSS